MDLYRLARKTDIVNIDLQYFSDSGHSIHIPPEYHILLDSRPGFTLTIPNGTNIFIINEVLGEFLQWSVSVIKQSGPVSKNINDLPERLPL